MADQADRLCFICGRVVPFGEDMNVHVNNCLDGGGARAEGNPEEEELIEEPEDGNFLALQGSEAEIPWDSKTLTIAGYGFQGGEGSTLFVAFSGPAANGVTGTVTAHTMESITVQLTGELNIRGGRLQAIVTLLRTNEDPPREVLSEETPVAVVTPAPLTRFIITPESRFLRLQGRVGESLHVMLRQANNHTCHIAVRFNPNNTNEMTIVSNNTPDTSTNVHGHLQPNSEIDFGVELLDNRLIRVYQKGELLTQRELEADTARYTELHYWPADLACAGLPGFVPGPPMSTVLFKYTHAEGKAPEKVTLVFGETTLTSPAPIVMERRIGESWAHVLWMPMGTHQFRYQLDDGAFAVSPDAPMVKVGEQSFNEIVVREAGQRLIRQSALADLQNWICRLSPDSETNLRNFLKEFDVNAIVPRTRDTLLHVAAALAATNPGCLLSLQMLVDAGGDVQALNAAGKRPIDLAEGGSYECIALLQPNIISAKRAAFREAVASAGPGVVAASVLRAPLRNRNLRVNIGAGNNNNNAGAAAPAAANNNAGLSLKIKTPTSAQAAKPKTGSVPFAATPKENAAPVDPFSPEAQAVDTCGLLLHQAVLDQNLGHVVAALNQDEAASVNYKHYQFDFTGVRPGTLIAAPQFWLKGKSVKVSATYEVDAGLRANESGDFLVQTDDKQTSCRLTVSLSEGVDVDQYEMLATPLASNDAFAWTTSGSNNKSTWTEIDTQTQLAALFSGHTVSLGKFRIGGYVLDQPDSWERTPLMVAATRGNPTITSYLLYRGASAATHSRFGHTPLTTAAANVEDESAPRSHTDEGKRHFETVYMLLSHPAVHRAFMVDPGQNALGETLLHAVARSGNLQLARLVLSFPHFRKERETKNQVGETPEDVAANAGITALFAQVKHDEESGPLPVPPLTFRECIANEDAFALQLIAKAHMAAINDVDPTTGATPLQFAVRRNSLISTVILLCHGADVTATDKQGRPLLSLAAKLGHQEIVRILLSHNATHTAYLTRGDKYGLDLNGDSVLHAASRAGSEETVRLLLAFGTFRRFLEVRNRQSQVPSNLSDSEVIKTAFYEALNDSARDKGLPPPAFTPRPSIICASCMSAIPSTEDRALGCECGATYCTECTMHRTATAMQENRLPLCVNETCSSTLPLEGLFRLMPLSQFKQLVNILVENETPKSESAYRQQCPICARSNDLMAVLSTGTPEYSCSHCCVFLCAVCNNVFPKTGKEDDRRLHQQCFERMPLYQLFLQFHVLLQKSSKRHCPTCETRAALPADGACQVTCSSCKTEWCYVCARTKDTLGCSLKEHYDRFATSGQKSGCPATLMDLAPCDARLRGLTKPDASEKDVRRATEQKADSLLSAARVRKAIIERANEIGLETFEKMCDLVKWKDMLANLYFGGKFPEGTTIPSWETFEPEEARAFYTNFVHWFDAKATPR